ncbi:hypothetical protein GCM10027515_04220 [Schumannella luteola]|uniref:Uncharacterized protein n=1 Tax=Schumannella luteola TaxID=472059 RepID=A0A852Y9A4_9MICO|nr:hypothetical protein [Schumannella luteola]NYG98442.1 hypothetical protein [Schumannella luteola]TPX01325.1 hypothetical protein FJ656_28480 [Schumannella luteola]
MDDRDDPRTRDSAASGDDELELIHQEKASEASEQTDPVDDPAADKGEGADVTAVEATPDDSVS